MNVLYEGAMQNLLGRYANLPILANFGDPCSGVIDNQRFFFVHPAQGPRIEIVMFQAHLLGSNSMLALVPESEDE